jgi:TolB-like protein/DNA-binding SARP family transcriptional activator
VLTLRLLGTASIEDTHGPLGGRAAQGRRLALLALLALARGRALTRDKIIALLWPEASPDRARPQLSDTLYILRGALGEDAVRAVGDGLALNPDAITSDVARFQALLDDGRTADAVALYAGPLLDGFHVPGSVEFESWLEGERAQLDRRFGQALEALAAAAADAGDTAAALAWWRRRAAHDPFNGRVALRLMHALEASGDRAAALQHARIHAALLRDEFDAEPDAELTAYADRLRSEPPAPVTPRSPGSAIRSPAPSAPGALPAPVPPATTVSGSSAAPAASSTSSGAPASSSAAAPAASSASSGESPSASADASRAASRQPRSRVRAVLAAAVGFVALVIGIAWGVSRTGAPAPAPARSVGVLPFVNMSPDPANTYFSDGLSEQIILGLSRIDGLQVAARTSSFALRDRGLSVRAIADTLAVQAVLEGSVLVDGERLRVIAQLIDARTGYHIWSDQYEGELSAAFGLQDSIAAAIADALHLRLAGASQPGRAPSLAAYDLYLRGLYLRNSLSVEALRQASDYFDRAIELEPRFALAYAAKASVIAPQAYFRYASRDSVMAELRSLTARALELDPTLGEAHVSLGVLNLFYEWNWDSAGAALRRATALNPNDPHAWHHLANYYGVTLAGREAVNARARAVQLDPLNARSRIVLANDHLYVGDFDLALAEARRAAQLDPINPLMLGRGPNLPAGVGSMYRVQGRNDEAVEEYLRVATLRNATPAEMQAMRAAYAAEGMTGFWKSWLAMDLRQSGPSPDPVRMAVTHLVAGDTVRGLDWLDIALAEHTPGLIWIRRDPVLSAMLTHPRVARVVRAMKFPE